MLNIGCHLSSANGYLAMGETAKTIDGNTFQFFTRNPRGGKAKKFVPQDAAALEDFLQQHSFAPILAHAPYTLNACSAKEETRNFALEVMRDDLERLEHLPHSLYNFHPGSHTGQGVETGIQQIADLLNAVITKEQTTTVLLETMAGKGTEVGSTFSELAAIIEKVELEKKRGVFLDPCHIFDGGYDIVNDLEGVLAEFDMVIGLERLKAIHINDSMNTLGCHKDRHAKIGQGGIGLEAFGRLINHPALRHLPYYLETPNDLAGYKEEIKLLRDLYR